MFEEHLLTSPNRAYLATDNASAQLSFRRTSDTLGTLAKWLDIEGGIKL